VVFPEGVAFDDASGFFFAGATADGAIFRGTLRDPMAEEFLAPGEDSRTVAVGMKVDAQGRLIIAGGPTGMVWVYDIDTGNLLASFDNGVPDGDTFLNDVVVGANGDVYVTDSFTPMIWTIVEADLDGGAGQTLDPWLDTTTTPIVFTAGQFNLNGLVVTPDGLNLLVVQSNTGQLWHINIATQTVTEVNLGGVPLSGGDGMLLDAQELFVVGNGRLRMWDMAADFLSGEQVSTLIDPSFHSPTTAAFANGTILVVNSQFDQQGGTPDLPFRISVIPR
jgi:Cu-Zn family superoxide dismutase